MNKLNWKNCVLVASLLIVAAPVASACPRLDGNYTCAYSGQFGNHVFELTAKTIDERGQAVYVVNGKKIYTDGKQQHTESLPILEKWANNVDYVGTCSGNAIEMSGSATVKKNNARANLTGTLTSQPSGNLAVVFNVQMGFFSLDFNVPCTKRK